MSKSVPIRWSRVKLGEVLTTLTDYHANGSYKNLKANVELLSKPDYARMIRTTNFEKADFQDDLRYITKKAYEFLHKSKVKPGDILMNKIASAGSVYYMPNLHCPASLGMNLFLLRTNEETTNQRFIYYYLKSHESYIKQFAIGTATTTITKDRVRNLEILLPPLSIQQNIASILSAYDDLIENNMRRIAILEEMAQSLYREWFLHFRFPGHEKKRLVESELGLIPEGWEVRNLSKFGSVVTGKTPSKLHLEYFGDEFMPFIKTPDMHGNVFCIKTEESLSEQGVLSQRNKTLPPNSLCVSCIGTAGIVSITTTFSQTNQQINSIILNHDFDREILYFSLLDLKETINQYGSNGATMVNLNKGKFEALKVIYPLETSIVAEFHDLTYPIFDEIKSLQIKNANLRKTRDLLLPKLISGEVDVEGLDIKTNSPVL
jgi:type I restriction enzyme S subunit